MATETQQLEIVASVDDHTPRYTIAGTTISFYKQNVVLDFARREGYATVRFDLSPLADAAEAEDEEMRFIVITL